MTQALLSVLSLAAVEPWSLSWVIDKLYHMTQSLLLWKKPNGENSGAMLQALHASALIHCLASPRISSVNSGWGYQVTAWDPLEQCPEHWQQFFTQTRKILGRNFRCNTNLGAIHQLNWLIWLVFCTHQQVATLHPKKIVLQLTPHYLMMLLIYHPISLVMQFKSC